jgi:hypothetical protein
MALATVALNAAADGAAGTITEVSLHSGDPGTTGASEISGGSYARLAPSYAAASADQAELSSSLAFSVAAGTSVAYWGAWAGSTFVAGAATTAATFTADGTYTLSSAPVQAQ